jgi:hypothetical protein
LQVGPVGADDLVGVETATLGHGTGVEDSGRVEGDEQALVAVRCARVGEVAEDIRD